MLVLSTLYAKTFDVDQIDLVWEIAATAEPVTDYTFGIYRAETPEPLDEFSLVEEGIIPTTYGYTDITVSGLVTAQWHDFYYRIKLEHINGIETAWTEPVRVETIPNSKAKIILKKRKKALEKYGQTYRVFKHKIIATQCPDCFDPTLGRIVIDNCLTCFGTGKVGGYYSQIAIKGAMSTRPKANQITAYGTWQPGDALLNFLNYPVLNPDDLIVDNSNRRWKIRQIHAKEVMDVVIGQQAHLSLQEKSNAVHDIHVDELLNNG